MSTSLTDLLIDVSCPRKLSAYFSDTEAFMKSYNLTASECEALRSGSAPLIRIQAVATNEQTEIGYRQFTASRTANFNPAVIEIEPVVEIQAHEVQQITLSGKAALFVDDDGRFYRAIPE